jgi:predicted TPR repeat methyltransferase
MNRKDRRAAQKPAGGMPGAPPDGMSPPGLGASLFAAAVQHFRAGQMAEAERLCRDLLTVEPDHVDALQLLGLAAYRLGDRAAAAELLSRAVELSPTLVPALVSLGNVLKAQGRLDEAAAQYRRALTQKPDDPMIHYNLGNVLSDQGRLDEAVAQYRRAQESAPNSGEILNNLATALQRQGRLDDAQALYQRALALNPNDAQAHNNLGNVFWQQDRYDDAVLQYGRALALNPSYLDAHNNLGNVLRKQGQPGEAFACFERALALNPDHTATQLNVCSTLYELSLADKDAAAAQAARLLGEHGAKPIMRRGLAGLMGAAPEEPHNSDYARELFDHFAGTFDKTLTELGYLETPRAIAAALDIADRAGPGLDVLDAGCGTGLCGPHFRAAARSLVGVDLSPKMLDKARALGIYDQLVRGDAIGFMLDRRDAFNVIVSSDVLPYIGDVSRFLRAAHQALRPAGQLAVSVESLAREECEDDYQLSASGRYQHSRPYLEKAFGDAGLAIKTVTERVMRREGGRPADAWILIAEKP